MILLISVVLLISTVAVGVHAAVLAVSPEPRPPEDHRHRISSGSKEARVPRKWEEQAGEW